jgi:hypothetical protein
MLTKFSNVIKNTSLLSHPNALQINMAVHTAWKELDSIDATLRSNVRVSMVKKQVVYMKTHDGAWAQEIQLRNLEIIDKLNKKLRKQQIHLTNVVIYVE